MILFQKDTPYSFGNFNLYDIKKQVIFNINFLLNLMTLFSIGISHSRNLYDQAL